MKKSWFKSSHFLNKDIKYQLMRSIVEVNNSELKLFAKKCRWKWEVEGVCLSVLFHQNHDSKCRWP